MKFTCKQTTPYFKIESKFKVIRLSNNNDQCAMVNGFNVAVFFTCHIEVYVVCS